MTAAIPKIARAIALLSLTDADGRVVSAAAAALLADGGGDLTLLHVARPGDYPDGSIVADVLAHHGERVAGAPGVRTTIIRRVGTVADEALDQAELDAADLIVATEAGMTTQRLVRRARCAVLVLPTTSTPAAAAILAPVEFGPNVVEVAAFAAALAARSGATLELLHVYSVPLGYSKLGDSYEDFAREMAKSARRRLERVAKTIAAETPPAIRLVLGKHAANAILDAAPPGKYAHIVMGGRCRTPVASAITLASVTERVVLTAPCPVWVVRNRNTPAAGILDLATAP